MTEPQLDELLRRVASELRRPVALSPDFDARVMDAVRQPAPGGIRRLADWLVTPRPIRISPLAGLAAAAVLAALVLAGVAGRPGVAPTSPPVPAVAVGQPVNPDLQMVQFVLVAPTASRVTLVGDFNDWRADATPLSPAASGGVWTVTVPLRPGQHQYAFVVDGSRWMADPRAPREIGDDFGSPSSLVTVTRAGRT